MRCMAAGVQAKEELLRGNARGGGRSKVNVIDSATTEQREVPLAAGAAGTAICTDGAVRAGVERYPARGDFQAPPKDDTVAAPAPGGAGYLLAKRVFDVAFSLLVCAALALPVAVLCALIALDSPGSPFFRQERVGLGGRPIRIWKLRTMHADAHENPGKYMTPAQLAQWEREQKVDDDPRVTRVGRVLRNTSLDELPQFINVLTGDLSVIGPRPVTLEETYEFGNARDEFLSVKPGITGWWQVTERNDATWANGDRQMLELFYVRHASPALDLRIFARTFKAMFIERTGK